MMKGVVMNVVFTRHDENVGEDLTPYVPNVRVGLTRMMGGRRSEFHWCREPAKELDQDTWRHP
jgi:hypothetical protein